ncbi:SLAC1 anion channel family protein [Plastoroseomonas arctica]|uniref:C4-dicarboxylate ABC transporter n=1 Tax=Plastoroseomonas arctica TaxID=1509237 RepID=A0AAF1JU09_9PROT|nr:SLAC1 anion channel family protein [Plastoroseomonas arctica]MBR0653506.1 C4-dicarboxylate ABC transporter [Plastoroseomonas arctica]
MTNATIPAMLRRMTPPLLPSLAHLPLGLFAAPMGVCGLGLAWRTAAETLAAPAILGEALLALGAATWLLLLGLHGLRGLRHPGALAADLAHPVRGAFIGAVTIGAMLAAGALGPYAPGAAHALWFVGAFGHLAVAAVTLRALLTAPRAVESLTPVLLIPLVGNIVAPAIGVRLGEPALGWGFFGIGAFLWLALHPILLGRLVAGPALPAPLRPTLAILLAPPAVGAIALVQLSGTHGVAALGLWGAALVVALALLLNLRDFLRLPFSLSAWGYTFPAAAFAIATMEMLWAHAPAWAMAAAWPVLAAASAIVALVATGTLRRAISGALLRPEQEPVPKC